MTRTRIKVCGLTRAEDVAYAVEAGVDAVGVVFAPSPRRLDIGTAAQILEGVPSHVARVGVFVDALIDPINVATERCTLTLVQLSGHEQPELCLQTHVPCIKTIGVGDDFDWQTARPFRGKAAAILLDTSAAGKAGGTGQTFDWSVVAPLPEGVLVFVAGGLNPENVGDCIRALRPYAVDVSSGVESAPGIKDHDKIRQFVAAVQAADQEVYGT